MLQYFAVVDVFFFDFRLIALSSWGNGCGWGWGKGLALVAGS